MTDRKRANWVEIRQKFESGMSLADICRNYGVTQASVYQQSHRNKWTKPHLRTVEQTVKASITTMVAKRLQEAAPAIDQAVKEWTQRTHEVAGKFVKKVSVKVEECEDPEDLQRLAGTLERADTVGRRALGLDRDAPSGPTVVNVAIGLAYRPSAASGGLVMDYASATDAQVVDVEPASEPGN